MTNEKILEKVKSIKNGTYVSLTKLKDLGKGITKETTMIVRIGVTFSNMQINSERETGSLPWGHWLKGYEKLVIEHKGSYYLRVTSVTPNELKKSGIIEEIYCKDGLIISKKEAENIIGIKKITNSEASVYNIKFDNIINIKQNNN
jgi:hypothetical protein